MNRERDEFLFKKYPALFEYALQTDEQTKEQGYFYPIKFGLEIGDGWYPIVEEVLENIKDSGGRIFQIKEKLGGLRMYVDNLPEKYRHIIEEAEDKCSRTCEVCGEPGKIVGKDGWWSCRCEEHSK